MSQCLFNSASGQLGTDVERHKRGSHCGIQLNRQRYISEPSTVAGSRWYSMNCAGSQEILFGKGDHTVLFRTFVSVDTSSLWGLAYFHNQQRSITRRQRTSRFPPSDCHCFPPKIAPSSVGDARLGASCFLTELEHPLEKVASGATNITPQFWLGLPNGLNVGEKDLGEYVFRG